MTRVRVEGFTISLDGYGAGPNQDISNPLGVGGTELHQWLFPTRTFQRVLFGKDDGDRRLLFKRLRPENSVPSCDQVGNWLAPPS